jgi:hypothetical protein
MMDVFPLEPQWVWLILAAVLGTAEIILPGFFLLWIGGAALLTGIGTLLFQFNEPMQFASFRRSRDRRSLCGPSLVCAQPDRKRRPVAQ